MIVVAIIFCQVPLYFLRGAFQADGVGMGLFSLWLAGTCVLLTLRMVQLPYWTSLLLALGAAVCFFLVTKARMEYNVLTYATLVVFLSAVLAASQSRRLITSKPVIRSIKFFADYSFTLYLVHYSIMFAAFLIRPERNFYIFAIMVLVANIVAIALAVPTEMRHREFARFLNNTVEKYLWPVQIAEVTGSKAFIIPNDGSWAAVGTAPVASTHYALADHGPAASSKKACTALNNCRRFFSMMMLCVPSANATKRLPGEFVSKGNSVCAM